MSSLSQAPSVFVTRLVQRWRLGIFSIVAAVLALAVLVAIVPGAFLAPRGSPQKPLAKVLERSVSAWDIRSLPLANSPEMRQAVEGILQFDDAIFLHCSQPDGTAVEIYAAYWRPGKVPYGLVGLHSPDTCWINNGWTCSSRRHAQRLEIRGRLLKPIEMGVYSLLGVSTHVMYWHLVGGRPHEDYQLSGWVEGVRGYWQRLPLLFRDLKSYSLNLAQQQLVVRISSTTPFVDLAKQPSFQDLMMSLEPLGLFEPTGAR